LTKLDCEENYLTPQSANLPARFQLGHQKQASATHDKKMERVTGYPTYDIRPDIAHNDYRRTFQHYEKKEFENSINALKNTILAFVACNRDEAYKYFAQFLKEAAHIEEFKNAENKIYRKTWEKAGYPTYDSHPSIAHDDFGRLAFHNLQNRSSDCNTLANVIIAYCESFIKNELKKIAKEFREGNIDTAKKNFELLFQHFSGVKELEKIQHIIYEHMWKLIGSSTQVSHPHIAQEDGRLAFHDLQNRLSSNIKKAEATEAGIRHLEHKKFSNDFELQQQVRDFYNRKGPFAPIKVGSFFPRSIKELLDKLFEQFQGVCFGEYHSDPSSKEFIHKNMGYFKSKGVTTLFMEQLFDDMQNDLEIFNQGGALSKQIEDNLKHGDRHPGLIGSSSYRELLFEARRHGIRIVAIDTKAATTAACVADQRKRLGTMNYVAAKIMKREMGNGKFIALMGANHLANLREIPGVCELTQSPSIKIIPDFVLFPFRGILRDVAEIKTSYNIKGTVNFALAHFLNWPKLQSLP